MGVQELEDGGIDSNRFTQDSRSASLDSKSLNDVIDERMNTIDLG